MKQPTLQTPDRRWNNRPPVREQDKYRVRWLWATLFGLIAALLPAGAYLITQNACLITRYELSGLRIDNQRLEEQEQRLQLDRAKLETLGQIEAWASDQRGMKRPDDDRIHVVEWATTEPRDWLASTDRHADPDTR